MQKWSQRSSPKNKSKEESQFAKTVWRGKMTFWAVSSQVMKHESTNTTLKRSGKMHNGRLRISHNQNVPSVQINSQNNVAEFFDIRGIVHYEFVPTGQTVNQVYSVEVVERLRETETTRTFCQQLMDLASRRCTCSHGTVYEGVFSY